MFGVLCFCFVLTTSKGLEGSSYPSSWSFNDKPILRYGPEVPEDKSPEPKYKVPDWVESLRQSIEGTIDSKGFENAKDDIRELIRDADEKINHQKSPTLRESMTENYPSILESQRSPPKPVHFEPRWEKELKELVGKIYRAVHDPARTDKYIRPTVEAIEENHRVKINNVDIDPYGNVEIIWEYNKSKKNIHPDFARMRGFPGYLP